MYHPDFTAQHRTVGRAAAWAVVILEVLYAVTLVLGLLSLQSPLDPIGDPYFTLMEILILLMVPAMVISMVAIHAYASSSTKIYSLSALAFMILMASITSGVHFVILTVSRQLATAGLPWLPLFISFTWPSVTYTLDILAWDFFFALSMLFAAPVFQGSGLNRAIRLLFYASAILSFAGLIGVPMADMNVRNIGIVGYVGVATVAFLLLGIAFGRTQPIQRETSHS